MMSQARVARSWRSHVETAKMMSQARVARSWRSHVETAKMMSQARVARSWRSHVETAKMMSQARVARSWRSHVETAKIMSRGDMIRTCDLLVPNQSRYQAAPRPDGSTCDPLLVRHTTRTSGSRQRAETGCLEAESAELRQP